MLFYWVPRRRVALIRSLLGREVMAMEFIIIFMILLLVIILAIKC